ncbi:hypothetical protein [Fusobacterium varium]|jgi:predicted nucleotidyltransferase|uniref:hypothetical protein n=1 Tax=Fusobacterium varium TaxID=856 RepID=UPI000E4249A2|nr:hypothetical protein [Fusobacterium varium]MCI6034212.1 hypothetical protein [Fusobacterium varium]RGJ28621.1 hypothetical protein DXD66_07690 [Fusobacterium varium]
MLDDIVKLIRESLKLFDNFEHIYIFGSVLNSDKVPNDIDILLLYSTCSAELIKKIDEICSTLKMLSGQTIDLTVLSFEEEKQTDFLNRLNSMYIKIK